MLTECLGIVFEMRHYQYRVVPLPEGSARSDRVLTQLLALKPDVLLINADLGPTCDGAALIAPMVRAGAAVVVLTDTADPARWGECLVQGARTVLSKSESLATVLSTVRRVSKGEAVLDRAERDRLIAAYQEQTSRSRDARASLDRLTPQEAAILRHLMAGRAVREIAKIRVVSEATVRAQVKAVLAKLRVNSQLAAVAAARQAGWGDASLPAAG